MRRHTVAVSKPATQATYQTIHLHRDAPPKPALGAACNGCGVCCASEPCPVGMLVSRRRRGRCSALVWQDDAARYVCGLITEPARFSRAQSPIVNRLVRAAAARFIASGIGCDASDEVLLR